jgi:hypothetical protein
MENPERDYTTFTAAQVFWSPRNLAATAFFYTFLVLFKVALISMIRINILTSHDSPFHFRAIELLHQTRVLLNLKDSR